MFYGDVTRGACTFSETPRAEVQHGRLYFPSPGWHDMTIRVISSRQAGYRNITLSIWSCRFPLFSKRQRITLRLLYAMSRPSVCLSVVCLSSVCDVGAPYSGGWTFRQFFFTILQLRDSTFLAPKIVGGGRPFPPEICVQSDPPPFKQRNFDKYRLIAP